MRHYCTLFDAKYLPQGLALFESLVKHSSEPFKLWILPLDDNCWYALRNLSLPDVELIALDGFVERMGLDGVRASRTYQEWCWTLASQVCEDLMTECGLPEITYLDADLWFMADPRVIFDEIGDRSIAVIPHRLAQNDQRERLSKNGLFNVSLVHFKNTSIGRKCLSTWAAQVHERCSAQIGCGDQCYLDEWPAKYGDELAVIQNIGAGTAPWNLANYEVSQGLDFYFQFRPYVNGKLVVFHHFHEFRKNDDGTFRLTNYQLRDEDRKYIYEPYIAAYKRAEQQIASVHLQV